MKLVAQDRPDGDCGLRSSGSHKAEVKKVKVKVIKRAQMYLHIARRQKRQTYDVDSFLLSFLNLGSTGTSSNLDLRYSHTSAHFV